MAATALVLRLLVCLASCVTGAPSFTEWLRDEAGAAWDDIVHHQFTAELHTCTLANETLARYLVQDHRFLDDFSVLLASVVAHAPRLQDRIPGAKFLALILGAENTYFERSLRALGVSEEEEGAVPNAAVTTKFKHLMRSAAHGGKLANMLAVLVVAEWSYGTWGARLQSERVPGLPFWCSEWIDLHSGDYFESVIAYLRGMLDRTGEMLTADERQEVRSIFLEAVSYEIEFFEMAYGRLADSAKEEL